MTLAFFVLGCALPMVVGGVIYLLFRDTGMLMFHWVEALGLMGALEVARAWAWPVRQVFPEWLLFSTPDGAWVFSYTAFFGRLWPDGPGWMRWSWILLGTSLAVGGELGQMLGFVPGTFDGVDVVAYLCAAGLALLLVRAWPLSAGPSPQPNARTPLGPALCPCLRGEDASPRMR